jgi:hypothetical protein
MYYVHRRYLVGLALAVVVAAASIVVPRVAHTIHEDQVSADFAAGDRAVAVAFKHLKLPSGFVAVRRGPLDNACLSARCYRVEKPSRIVAATIIPKIFRRIGANDAAEHGSCSTSATCEFSIPIGPPSGGGEIDVWINPLENCQSLSPRRGCRPANASVVTFY